MGKPTQMIDTGAVQDIFVSGLGEIEALGGGVFRFTYFTLDHGEHIVAARLIASKEVLADALKLASSVAGLCTACETVKDMPVN